MFSTLRKLRLLGALNDFLEDCFCLSASAELKTGDLAEKKTYISFVEISNQHVKFQQSFLLHLIS